MYIVTTQQMQAAEKTADAAGLSYEQMMENAGHAIAEAIAAEFEVNGVQVLVLVGPGNNGGDGLVTARYLAQMGATVSVYVWKRQLEADQNWTLLDAAGVEKILSQDQNSPARLSHLLDESGVIVDALLGTGVSRPIEGSLAELLNQTKAIVTGRRSLVETGLLVAPSQPAVDPEFGPAVVAVDVPSGLNSDTGAVDPYTLPADLTVTLAAVKVGHLTMPGPEVTGQLVVADIGISADHYPDGVTLEMVTASKVAAMLPERPVNAHKGTFGTALLVAGSMSYTGAAILAGQAALRSGVGMVTLAPPQAIHPILASRLAEATYIPLPHAEGAIAPEAVRLLQARWGDCEAMLVGPGLSQATPTIAFLKELLSGKASGQRIMGFKPTGVTSPANDKAAPLPPLVLDADALNILAELDEWWRLLPPETILTPHPGEMGRLTKRPVKEVQAHRLEMAAEMAAKWGQVVLLKGAHTVIAGPDDRIMMLPFANPALAKAGSGDVLAGTIVGLRAQGLAAFEAAVAGAYLHGLTGELARENLGATAVIAGDLIDFLPVAIRQIQGE